VIFWVFANFQIGVSHASAISSGFFAFRCSCCGCSRRGPRFWSAREIAVAHRVDRVLVHGVVDVPAGLGRRTPRPASRSCCSSPGWGRSANAALVTEDDLARELRLTPAVVRDLCFRLVQRGLLAEDVRGFSLVGDPDRLTFDAVADAIDRDPRIDGVQPAALRRPYAR
jgi:hypothetical protein